MARLVSIIFIVLILVLVIFFTTLNADPVNLDYYLGKIQQPLALIVIVSFVAGAIIGLLVSVFMILSARRDVAKLRRHIKSTEQEVQNLRALPLKDKH